MDDASFANDNMGGDPGMMGSDPNAGGINGDPNTMDGEPVDAPAEEPIQDNPNMNDPNMTGDDSGMDVNPEPESGEEGTGDDTASIINQLSDEDKEAVRAYAESMLNKNGGNEGAPEEEPNNPDQPMMEQVIFTKKQLKKINEEFGINNDELNKDQEDRKNTLPKKTSKTTSNKSPFNPKKFK